MDASNADVAKLQEIDMDARAAKRMRHRERNRRIEDIKQSLSVLVSDFNDDYMVL
jgi:hypothetical protein